MLAGALLGGAWLVTRAVCVSAWLRHGLVVPTCPDRELRPVFEFIEGWYNPRRRHSALDYESPINHEEKMLAA